MTKKKTDIFKKLQAAEGLFNIAYSSKTHQLRKKHPQLSEREIHIMAMQLIEKGCA